jgi:DNA ligase-1
MILHDLKATAGATGKKFILRTKADTFDKDMFRLAYDPGIMYNLKYNHIDWSTVKPLHDMDVFVLNRLHNREVTGNAAREMVEHHCQQYGDLVKLICNKDLDCGVSAKTLVDVFGKGFVPMFEVALADEDELTNINFPVLAQTKFNGVRVVAIVTKDGVQLRTRNGKSFKFEALEAQLKHSMLTIDDEHILDGELTLGDSNTSDHTNVSGLVNSAIRGNPVVARGLVYTAFDTMSLKQFNNQDCNDYYDRRFQNLGYRIANINAKYEGPPDWYLDPLVRIVENHFVADLDTLQSLFATHLSAGYEGLILKHWTHKYNFKRSKVWTKMKATKTVDLRCKGIKYGDESSKYAGLIGALECYGKVEGKDIEVFVGSGLNDHDRALPEFDYIGNMIELKYNSIIQDKRTGLWSLYLPRFITVRGDIS